MSNLLRFEGVMQNGLSAREIKRIQQLHEEVITNPKLEIELNQNA